MTPDKLIPAQSLKGDRWEANSLHRSISASSPLQGLKFDQFSGCKLIGFKDSSALAESGAFHHTLMTARCVENVRSVRLHSLPSSKRQKADA